MIACFLVWDYLKVVTFYKLFWLKKEKELKKNNKLKTNSKQTSEVKTVLLEVGIVLWKVT